MNKLYEHIPSTYKINTLLYDLVPTKRPCESNTESSECKRKENGLYFSNKSNYLIKYWVHSNHVLTIIMLTQIIILKSFYE